MAKDSGTSVHFDRENFEFVGLDESKLKQLKSSYFNTDVDAELKKMKFWLQSPKGKSVKGTISFIANWLSKALPSKTAHIEAPESDTPLQPYLDEYLKDLWKNREHIIHLNRRS